MERNLRRNDFPAAERAERRLPRKELAPAQDRIVQTVSPEMAELAGHLADNPVFEDVMAALENEALDEFRSSELGQNGNANRTAARYALEALSVIRSRLQAMGAERALHNSKPTD